MHNRDKSIRRCQSYYGFVKKIYIMTGAVMNRQVNYCCRALSANGLFLILIPTIIFFFARQRVSNFPLSVATLFTILAIADHAYILSKRLPCEWMIKKSILLGLFFGIVLALAGRAGLVLSHFIWASDKNFGNVFNIFTDSWWLYVCLGMFGAFSMSIKPLLEGLKQRDSNG